LTHHLIGEIKGAPFDMPFTLRENQTILSAIRFVIENPNIRGFAVLDNQDHVTGFLPMRELGKYSLNRILPRLSNDIQIDHILPSSIVKNIMLPPITVNFEDSLNNAIRIMLDRVSSEVHIVDADHIILGSLTIEKIFSILEHEGLMKRI
jgi:CBS-domain-containing membrane protein